MVFLFGSNLPRLMEIIFTSTFHSILMLYWLCFFHGIRQTNRTFGRFYCPKLLICGTFWLSVTYVTSWSRIEKLEKPTLDEEFSFHDSSLLKFCSFSFYVSIIVYTIYLSCLMLAAFTELRSMPYFDQRIKIQSFMISFSLTVAVLVVLINFPAPPSLSSSSFSAVEDQNEVSRIPFLQLLPWTYESSSSASFLALFSVSNLYVYFSAYFYYPSSSSLAGEYQESFPIMRLIILHETDSRIVRDNPTLSMMNDSDEEIIYEPDADRPLNQINLIETLEDDDDSD